MMEDLFAYETWHGDMVEKIKMGLARRIGCKSEEHVEDLAPMDRGNGEEQVRSRLMKLT
jgi:hypothetical protein